MRFLLDTNVLSEPVRGRPDPAILDRLETYAGQIATGAPVWHELWCGCFRLPDSRRRDFLTDYLRVIYLELPILEYDARAAEWHARERARLSAIGRTPPFVDGQIAAIAAVNQLTLVSRNVRDFTIFDELRVEDWRRG